jgi:hypothetical protein
MGVPMASRNEYILSRCKANNRCSINDEIIQLLDYQFSAVVERQGIRVSQTHHLCTNFKFDLHDSSDEVMLALNDRQ